MARRHRKGDRVVSRGRRINDVAGGLLASKTSRLPWINGGIVLFLVCSGFGLPFLIKQSGSSWATYDAAPPISSAMTGDVTTGESSTEVTAEETTNGSEPPPEVGSEPPPEVGATPSPSSGSTETTGQGGGSGDPPAASSPEGLGADPALDSLAEQCFEGDMAACDDLFVESPFDSDYEAYGNTCGQRVPEAEVDGRDCVVIFG